MDPKDPRAPATYRSIAVPKDVEIVIEKSRFIAYAAPVESEEAARAFVDNLREQHREATHVVSAWIIGSGGLIMRASDDGEPQGTAGVPTLEVLRKEALTDVVCATVRYFGGIKLGAGGLIRAYTRSAAEVISAAGVVDMVRQKALVVSVPYPMSGTVSHQLEIGGWQPKVRYDSAVHYDLSVPNDLETRLSEAFANWSSGQATLDWGDERYAPKPDAVYERWND